MYSFDVSDFDEWRTLARALLTANIAPDRVSWQPLGQPGLFASSSLDDIRGITQSSRTNKTFQVPRDFLRSAKQASCFLDPKNLARKWSILYSLLWRIANTGRDTLRLTSDSDVRCLNGMCKAVSRDMHKMKAFVRFQTVVTGDHNLPGTESSANGAEYYVAWFEPSHAIIDSIAPFFVKRFTGMHWSILTPLGCAHWDRKRLEISNGIPRPEIKGDSLDVFWKTYYRNIFNPARLKEKAMSSEMPKKYWKYLPEASCIQDLTRGAATLAEQMIDAPATNSHRVRRKSQFVTQFQNNLRKTDTDQCDQKLNGPQGDAIF